MKEKKINYALKKFSVYELNSFRRFLNSPYFNQNEAFIKYFDLLNDSLRKEVDINDITNLQIWTKIYGTETPYDDKRFRKLVSDFYKLFDEFITQKEMESDESMVLNLKLKAYKKRNLAELYPTAIQQVEQSKKLINNKGAEYYLNLYNIEKSLLAFKNELGLRDKKLDLEKELNLSEISLNLDVFYIAEKLKYYSSFLSWKRSFKLEQKIAGIEFILKLAKTELFKDFPPIAIYFLIVQTLKDEFQTNHFYELKKLLTENLYLFNLEESKELIDSLISYSTTKANMGSKEFELECFNLYKNNLSIITSNALISSITFRNIIGYAVRAKEFDWVEQFIKDYSKYLPETERENNVTISLARIYWNKKMWNETIEQLRNVEYKEEFQALLSKTMILTSFYELTEIESLESFLISFKVYLDREKSLNKERKQPYYNLIKYIKQMLKLTHKTVVKNENLIEEIKATKGIVAKDWLLEKIEEIHQGKRKF